MSRYTAEYVLKLKDQFTSTMNRVNASASGFSKTVNGMANQMGSQLTGMVGGFVGVGAAIGLWKKAFSEAMDFEKQLVGFEVLLGSAGEANKLMGQLTKFSASTPFQLPDLQKATTTLLSFGVAQKDVMTDLRMLGDVAQGDSQKLSGLTRAFGKVQAKGRLTGEEVNMMIDAGFNPLLSISKRTGESMAELQTRMAKGQVSAKELTLAFSDATGEGGQFNGMMEKMSQTAAGKWSTAQDNFNAILRSQGQFYLPTLNYGLEAVNDVMTGKFVPALQNGGKFLLKMITPLQILDRGLTLTGKSFWIFGKQTKEAGDTFDYYNLAVQSAKNVTDEYVTSVLPKLQQQYGLTEEQVWKFVNAQRELNKTMTGQDESTGTISDYKKQIAELQKVQEQSMDRGQFKKTQKEIDAVQRKIDKITGKNTVSSTGKGAAGGGGTTISSRAPQYFTINISQLVGEIYTQRTTVNQSDTDLKKQVTETLVSALNDAQLVAASK